ncbi:MAG: hypothetical protein JST26_20855 [Bacteroidetes bacterium]|nr:hypothetical protein [Bacteroidota bacterium]
MVCIKRIEYVLVLFFLVGLCSCGTKNAEEPLKKKQKTDIEIDTLVANRKDHFFLIRKKGELYADFSDFISENAKEYIIRNKLVYKVDQDSLIRVSPDSIDYVISYNFFTHTVFNDVKYMVRNKSFEKEYNSRRYLVYGGQIIRDPDLEKSLHKMKRILISDTCVAVLDDETLMGDNFCLLSRVDNISLKGKSFHLIVSSYIQLVKPSSKKAPEDKSNVGKRLFYGKLLYSYDNEPSTGASTYQHRGYTLVADSMVPK